MFGFRWCGSESERVLVNDSAVLNDVLCDGGQPRKDPVLREFLVEQVLVFSRWSMRCPAYNETTIAN